VVTTVVFVYSKHGQTCLTSCLHYNRYVVCRLRSGSEHHCYKCSMKYSLVTLVLLLRQSCLWLNDLLITARGRFDCICDFRHESWWNAVSSWRISFNYARASLITRSAFIFFLFFDRSDWLSRSCQNWCKSEAYYRHSLIGFCANTMYTHPSFIFHCTLTQHTPSRLYKFGQ
jgi:hypothetical protein